MEAQLVATSPKFLLSNVQLHPSSAMQEHSNIQGAQVPVLKMLLPARNRSRLLTITINPNTTLPHGCAISCADDRLSPAGLAPLAP
jgi:hypothetical protein